MMSFQDAIKVAGAAKPGDFQPAAWEETQARYPGDKLPFLEDAFVADATRYVGLTDEVAGDVRAAAAEFRRRPEILRLLWHCHSLVFEPPERDVSPHWLCPGLGNRSGMFPLLVLLSGLPRLKKFYADRGIPADVAAHTMSDVGIWMRVWHGRTGNWGLAEISWLLCHFSGFLVRLGRLQFQHIKWHGGSVVFRNRKDGRVVLLCEDGAEWRADGNVNGSNGIRDEKGAWKSRIVRTGKSVRGSPVSEDVLAVKDEVELPLDEWEQVLAKGDPVMDMHIPAGEPLTPEACNDSFRRALEFWPKHYPEFPAPKGFVIYAWLMDPGLRKVLPPTANLVRFQDLFHRYPVWGDENGLLDRMFGDKRPDLSHPPRSETLRGAVTAFRNAGGRFNGGAGGVLKEHLK